MTELAGETTNVRLQQRIHGFTALELLVILAIMGCLMALKLPAIQNAQREANEGSAQQVMLAIAEAQTRYQRENPDGDGRPDCAENLRVLGAVGYVEPVVASGQKNGYSFTMICGTLNDAVYVWDAVASPTIWGVTGTRFFHINAVGPLTETTVNDSRAGPLPGLTQVARTIANEIASYDPSGEAIISARKLLRSEAFAIKRLSDTNGDGELTLEELLNADLLALARKFVGEHYGSDASPVLGDDEALEVSLEKLIDVLRETLEHRGVDQEAVSVRLEDIQGDPTSFFDQIPAQPGIR